MYEVIGFLMAVLVVTLVARVMRLRHTGHPRYADGGAIGAGALATVVAAGFDFCFDVVSLGELRGGLAVAGHAAILLSMSVNTAAIVVVLKRAVRDRTLDLHAAQDLSAVVTLALLLSMTNLDSLVLLPWALDKESGRSRGFLGFPTRDILLLTMLSVVFENIPQLIITYLNAEKRFIDQDRPVAFFSRLKARRCTAMGWIFIPAYCFAIP